MAFPWDHKVFCMAGGRRHGSRIARFPCHVLPPSLCHGATSAELGGNGFLDDGKGDSFPCYPVQT